MTRRTYASEGMVPVSVPTLPTGWRDDPAVAKATLETLRAAKAARTAADPFGTLGYVPTAKQAEFHAATEHDVLYGGAAGGGKSKALLMECLRVAATRPGVRVGAFRRTYDELAESLLKELASVGFADALGAVWNGAERQLTFPNGSVIRFRYAENEVDASRRQGGEYQMLAIDERGLMRNAVVALLEERLRSGRADVPVVGIRSTTNPGGPSHGTIKVRYVKATDSGQRTYTDEQDRTVRFIPALVRDNPHVDKAYVRQLDAIPDPARRAAMRDGDWDSFAGQSFLEWRHDRHVVPRIELPASWSRYAGMDYGWTAPSVIEWAARDNDGRMWFYRELTMRQTPEREQARRVLAAESGERVLRRNADPAMWGKTSSANPPAVQFSLEGCVLTAADNARVPGKQRMHTYLADGPACPVHRELGWDTCPMLHVLDGTCPELVRTLPDLPLDPRNPEDVDTSGDDHWYDAARYLLMGIGVAPSFVFPADELSGDLLQPIGGGVAVDRDALRTPISPRFDTRLLDDIDELIGPDQTGLAARFAGKRSPWV